jgi:isoleucyl-tRNA synthetase
MDRYDPSTPAPPTDERPELDRWIVSELNSLVAGVTEAFERFEPDDAAHRAEQFVEYLSNWYVRRSRRRFWKSGLLSGPDPSGDEDKLSAYATLYECLVTLTKLLAPVMPFTTESMYQNLVRSVDGGRESVHLDSYPKADASRIDTRLADATRLAMRLSSLGRAARSKAGIKVRQPLAEAVVSVPSQAERQYLADIEEQLRDELNVKSVRDAAEVAGVIRFEIRPNFELLGPKYGPEVPKIVTQLAALHAADVALHVENGRHIRLEDFELLPDEVLVNQTPVEGYAAASEGGYTVAVTTEISPELALEGLARELVHRVQNMRREAGFDIADYIVTYYQDGEGLDEVVSAHGDYIRQETLSRELVNEAPTRDAHTESHSVDGIEMTLGVKREE